MRKPFAAMFALKRFLSCMNSLMLLQVMLEFECFPAMAAFKLPKIWTILVVRHMPVQFCQGGELLTAQGTGLK